MACLPCFLSFCPAFCPCFCPFGFPFLSLLQLSFVCPLALSFLSCFVFVFAFSLTDYTQKRKGAKVLLLASSLRVLWVLDSCIVIKKFRCRCFGFFQFVRFVLPCNAARIRRLARSYFYPFRHNIDITYNRSAFLK